MCIVEHGGIAVVIRYNLQNEIKRSVRVSRRFLGLEDQWHIYLGLWRTERNGARWFLMRPTLGQRMDEEEKEEEEDFRVGGFWCPLSYRL